MFAVNLHVLRGCSVASHCFSHDKPQRRSAYHLPPLAAEDYEVAIGLLAQEGCTKIDVLGGDLFRVPQLVPSILEQAKRYGIFTGVITNGAFATVGSNLDMFGVSIDSFDTETNERMKKEQGALETAPGFAQPCKRHGCAFQAQHCH